MRVTEGLWQDVRFGVRSLARTPGFTVAAVLTLTLGIGANTTIFTMLDAVLFKPLPLAAASELVTFYENAPEGTADSSGGTGRFVRFPYDRFRVLEQALGHDGSLAAMTRSSRFTVRLAADGQALATRAQMVSGGYFPTLGVSVASGRPISDDDVQGERPVAVISDGFWRRVLGAAPDAVGRTIRINGLPVSVIGIAPPGFVGLWSDNPSDFWVPLTLQQNLRYNNNASSYGNADRTQPWVSQDKIAWLNLVARIPGDRLPAARVRLEAANRAALPVMAEAMTTPKGRQQMLAHTLQIESFSRGFSALRTQFSAALWALSAIVAIVLLVTCANIANLLLVRGAGRAREASIRVALGASRLRLIRQALVESLLLAITGGVAGLLLAEWASGTLAASVLQTTRAALPPVFSPDARTLWFTAALSVGSAIVFGLVPALRATGLDVIASLATFGRSSSGRSPMTGMRPLVTIQLALSLVVVCAAGLLGRTLTNFGRVDPGFDIDRVVSAAFDPAGSGYTRLQMPALNQRLIDVARAVPGVTAAAVSTCGLLANCTSSASFRIEGFSTAPSVGLNENWVSGGYFATVGIPVLGGREFDDRDTRTSSRVAIVTASVARRYFGDSNPIGMHVGFKELDTQIVGVVGDARAFSLRDEPAPTVYFPVTQDAENAPYTANLDVRIAGGATATAAALNTAIRRAEPGLVVDGINGLSRRVERNVSRERIVTYLATAFAVLATFLACLGLYGVLSYSVARRTHEMGIRMALGAAPGTLSRMVFGDAFRMIAAGMAAGVLAAIWASRLLDTLLFGVSDTDVLSYAGAVAAVMLVTLAAGYVPARRASRVNPAVSLRTQ